MTTSPATAAKTNQAAAQHLPKARDVLRGRRAELAERLVRIQRDRQRQEQPLSADFSEQATERENDEVLDRLAEATGAELRQVSHALERLDAGLYGICEVCGEEIAAPRLAALPDATVCQDCANTPRRA
jgi:DnaK suppressor protein